ncbi:hypothetical protein MJO28_009977 [Puccinia striiformis f. sp. tritici]|uniref:RING-CH-type domain-containing protein n=2 Tax=Puccinia striiformis f. sp. tritici TaxID=168172 RepID=A0A0L0V8A0_9BASI|nr:hypothetical protein Pst134EA_017199 [Puccinia striiformis f. sp. tritici]KAH9460886.1 hypothetical protein Pst134EA_017199 [Puccinia striiformis f. sp. tritici]KAI7948069.1 hypothetical protein MJO28_009977 [Puccinia striiformis f. sp. tritici]KNE95502.1 hypothetical protein PSTG_11215 [Puccinia striiformis f. sp. tritici PST-78]
MSTTNSTNQNQSPSKPQPAAATNEEKRTSLLQGFPDDFPHRSTSNNPLTTATSSADATSSVTPSTSSALMFHGSTTKSKPSSIELDRKSSSTKNYSEIQSAVFKPLKDKAQPQKPEARTCWICYDDEEEEQQEPNQNLQQTRSHRRKPRWVKACRCSLVAHESCLLTWITTYQLTHPTPASISSPLSTPVKCPQCAAIYQIVQPASPLLSILHRLKRPYNASMSWSALGCVVLGIGVSASSYGLWASRCFLGPVRWNRWVSNTRHGGGGLSFMKFFQLSLVGPILILSRTKQLDSVLPFLPISLILSNFHPLGLDSEFNDTVHHHLADPHPLRLEHIFPPEPGLTLCLIPWMRIGWSFVWSRISNSILRREYLGMSYQYPIGVGLGLAGQAQAAAGADGIRVGVENEARAGRERVNEENEEAENQANVAQAAPAAELVLDYSSFRTIIRVGMEALILPGAASLVGTLLLVLSRNRPWLRTLLGLKITSSFLAHQPMFYQQQSSSGTSFLSSLKTSVGQIVYRLFRLDILSPNSSDQTTELDNPINNPLNLHKLISGFKLVTDYNINPEDDPVWWRNTIAGALIIVCKDILSLTEKVLKLRKLKYRRIIDVVDQ